MTSKHTFVRWAVDLSQWKPTLHDITFASSCIQSEEKERLMKFHFRDDFNASLIGRLLMRKFIKDYTDIPYNEIHFNRDNKGKPILSNQLENFQHIDLNVSHHGSFSILTGITQNKLLLTSSVETQNDDNNNIRIGTDIMKIEYSGGKPLNEFFRLMNRNFSYDEWKFIKNQRTEFDQLKAFMRNWCLKECYVKNIGVGITINLQRISFNIKTEELTLNSIVNDTILKIDDTILNNWKFEEHLLDENHCAAISIKNPPSDYIPNNFEFLTFNDLLKNAIPLQELDESYARKVFCKELKCRNI